jgi:hypothetical protein
MKAGHTMTAALALSVFASSCAPTVWYRPETTQAQFGIDNARCRLASKALNPDDGFSARGSAAFVVGATVLHGIGQAAVRQSDFNDCMQANGYVAGAPVAPAAAAAPAPLVPATYAGPPGAAPAQIAAASAVSPLAHSVAAEGQTSDGSYAGVSRIARGSCPWTDGVPASFTIVNGLIRSSVWGGTVSPAGKVALRHRAGWAVDGTMTASELRGEFQRPGCIVTFTWTKLS